MPVLKQIETVRGAQNYLLNYASNVTSQNGEDGVVEKIFSMIQSTAKWCVEFGAWNGKEFSNTWNLIHNNHWRAVLIEANPERYNELVENNRDHPGVICMNRKVDFSGESSLDNLLRQTEIPYNFDFLSIDVDGNDYHIWDSLSYYVPKLVVIEFNPTVPNDIIFIQDRDMSINQGCSLRALIDLAERKGYELIAVTDWNAFFVIKDLFPLFGICDNSIDCMYDQSRYETKMFQLFDGTIILNGLKKLLWHNIDISDEDMQILPRHQRVYSDRVREQIKGTGILAACKKHILRK
jgi:hypothetical protein